MTTAGLLARLDEILEMDTPRGNLFRLPADVVSHVVVRFYPDPDLLDVLAAAAPDLRLGNDERGKLVVSLRELVCVRETLVRRALFELVDAVVGPSLAARALPFYYML